MAQEAAKLILRFGFTELDLRKIRGVAVSENEAVNRFASRLGFSSRVPREGEPWMLERGWTATDWVMTRETWENRAG
jgi:RimJ/RimL family protein N-acetyltransferase